VQGIAACRRPVRCKRGLDSCRTLAKAPHGSRTLPLAPRLPPDRTRRFRRRLTWWLAATAPTGPTRSALTPPTRRVRITRWPAPTRPAAQPHPAELSASAATGARCRPATSKTQRTWTRDRLPASYLTTGKSAAGRRPQRNRCVQRRPPPRLLHLRVRPQPAVCSSFKAPLVGNGFVRHPSVIGERDGTRYCRQFPGWIIA